MYRDKVATGKAMSVPGGVAVGVSACLAVILMGSAVLAWLLDREMIGWDAIGYGIVTVLLTASFLGTWVAMIKIKRRLLLVGTLTCVSILGILVVITGLLFGGQYAGLGVTGGVVASGSVCALLLQISRRGERNKKISRMYRRKDKD